MLSMLCRNRGRDFATWKRIFDSQDQAAREAGLTLVRLWCDREDPNNVFFLFEVADLQKAQAFISAPSASEAGQEAGVLDGEIHFLDEAPGD
jgi:hypothetical protein